MTSHSSIEHIKNSFLKGWYWARDNNPTNPISLMKIQEMFPEANANAFANAVDDYLANDLFRFNLIFQQAS